MQHNNEIKVALKEHVKKAFFAKETSNREQYANHKEIIRKLWRHRHSGKPVSAVI